MSRWLDRWLVGLGIVAFGPVVGGVAVLPFVMIFAPEVMSMKAPPDLLVRWGGLVVLWMLSLIVRSLFGASE